MIRRVRADEVLPGLLVRSAVESDYFVPCWSVGRDKGRVRIEADGFVARLIPNHRIAALYRPRHAWGTVLAKSVLAALESDGRAAASLMRVEAARLAGIEGADVAAGALVRLARRTDVVADDDLVLASIEFERWLSRHGRFLESRVHTITIPSLTDPHHYWANALLKYTSEIGAGAETDRDEMKDFPQGKKIERPSCDNCGAPLRRKGPALKRGWGLYVCDYCDSEYSVKER